MPKGYDGAKKAGEFSGTGFQPRPPGVRYFSLKSGETAVVRFLEHHDGIDWARKWKLPPSGNFTYGELVNCVDQHEDGTPDPGFQKQLKSAFKAYPTMIWRNAPQFQKMPDGKLVKDGMNNKIPNGYADTVAVWECSFAVYDALRQKELKFRSIQAFDWEVKRVGGGTDTKYLIEPLDPMNLNVPLTALDQQLAAAQRIDTAAFTKVPTFEELNAYLNGGVSPAPAQTFEQQVNTNTVGPIQGNPFM